MWNLGVHVEVAISAEEIARAAALGYRLPSLSRTQTIYTSRSKDRDALVKRASKAIRAYTGDGQPWYEITES